MRLKYSIFAWAIFILVAFFMSMFFYLISQGSGTYAYQKVRRVMSGEVLHRTVEPAKASID